MAVKLNVRPTLEIGLAAFLVCGMTASFSTTLSPQTSNADITIGVVNDQSGIYAAASGYGSVVAARMAAEDFNNAVLGRNIKIVFADHQNRPDVGTGIVRRW